MRDAARRFAMERVLPLANELDPVQGEMPDELLRADGRDGLLRHPRSRGVRRARPRRVRVLPGHRGAGPGLDERGQHHRPRQRPRRAVPAPSSAEELLPQMARGEYLGAVRHLRAGRRLRRGVDPHPGRARRRRVGAQRHRRCGARSPTGADYLIVLARTDAVRPRAPPRRHPQLLHPEGARAAFPPGIDRQPDPQDRLPRLEDLGAVASTTSGAGRVPARVATPRRRRAAGFKTPLAAWPSARAAHRRALDRPGPRRAGGRDRLRPARGCSSAGRSATSRPSASRSPRWRRRSRRAAALMYQVAADADAGRVGRPPGRRW